MAFTAKQEAFINEYLKCRNATKAAKRAGYSERNAGAQGHENLKKPDILAEIKRRTAENAMAADEALSILADHARGDMSDFISIKGGLPFIDLDKAAAAGKLHLLKKFKVTDKGVEIELYDAQSALSTILKELHLTAQEPTDRVAVDDSLSDAERASRIAAILDAARTRRDGQSVSDSNEQA